MVDRLKFDMRQVSPTKQFESTCGTLLPHCTNLKICAACLTSEVLKQATTCIVCCFWVVACVNRLASFYRQSINSSHKIRRQAYAAVTARKSGTYWQYTVPPNAAVSLSRRNFLSNFKRDASIPNKPSRVSHGVLSVGGTVWNRCVLGPGCSHAWCKLHSRAGENLGRWTPVPKGAGKRNVVCLCVCVCVVSGKVSHLLDHRIQWDLDHSLLLGLRLVTVDAKFRLVLI